MQFIFLDTEFTDFSHPQLISIGLAESNGQNFYAEVSYLPEACTKFVRDIVLPLLTQANKLSVDELREKLQRWLDTIKGSGPIVVCYDSDYDGALFLDIFEQRPPAFLVLRRVGYRHINELLRREFYIKNNLAEHHALNDAMALRYAFRGEQRVVR
jgi:hypothetical protein